MGWESCDMARLSPLFSSPAGAMPCLAHLHLAGHGPILFGDVAKCSLRRAKLLISERLRRIRKK